MIRNVEQDQDQNLKLGYGNIHHKAENITDSDALISYIYKLTYMVRNDQK